MVSMSNSCKFICNTEMETSPCEIDHFESVQTILKLRFGGVQKK